MDNASQTNMKFFVTQPATFVSRADRPGTVADRSTPACSAGPANGAALVIRAPISVEPHPREGETLSAQPDAEARAPEPALLPGIRVLAVDDDPEGCRIVRQLLEEHQAAVRTASSAAEAIEEIRRQPPDILISDINMPIQDGYELIRQIRALPPERGGRTPAVALTALARTEDRIRALEAGYQVHVAKPFEPDELVAIAARLASHDSERLAPE